MGATEDISLTELRRIGCMDTDNVHLKYKVKQLAAKNVCRKVMESRRGEMETALGKKRRLE